jgi:hypothetical protein
MSGINYRFNTWRESGDQAEEWSSKAYKLLNYNNQSSTLTGFKIGQVLYYYHLKGLQPKQIKDLVGQGMSVHLIKGIIKGFGRTAGQESIIAYQTAMEMLQDEQERAVLEKLYNN